MVNTEIYTYVRIHKNLAYGETIYFKKFYEKTKIDTILEKILDEKEDIIKIHIYHKE